MWSKTMIDEEGNFTEEFTEALPGMLGLEKLEHEDGSPIKTFEATPNLSSLAKAYHDTKTAYGKKLENVIQKPGENASDEDIAAYNAELDAARGVPTEAQSYEFPLLDGETEEALFTDDHKTEYQNFAKENKIPASTFSAFVQLNRKLAAAQAKAVADKIEEAENKTIEAIKEKNKGDALVVAGKRVFNALSKFNKNNPEFLAKLKEQDVFNNPTDFQRWKNAGVTPQNYQAWLEIANELKISHSVDGSKGSTGGTELKDLLPKSAADLGAK
jgi:hypothetical protein